MRAGRKRYRAPGKAEREQVLWITNVAAPYRIPVWRHLSEQFELTVTLLVKAKNFHVDASNRGAEWALTAQASEGFALEQLGSFRIPRLARPVHFLRAAKEWRRFPAQGSVLLGGWEEPVYWQALMIAKIKGTRAVGFYESTEESQAFTSGIIAGARRLFFRSLDGVVVPGVAAASAIKRMGVSEHKIWQGFNAVDVEGFHRARGRTEARSREDGHRFVFVGQLIERKNVPAIIEAFGRIATEKDTLTIIGSGQQEAHLRRQAVDGGLQDRVVLLGPVSYRDLPDVLVNYDTLVLASQTEVWGLVVNEALAAGLHCVVGQRSGVAASVQGMKGVFLSDIVVDELAASMSLSRSTWAGPIITPEILGSTPEAFASTFADALRRNRNASDDARRETPHTGAG